MTNELVVFDFENLPVRIVKQGEEPWFVLADVCAVLGVENPRNVAARLDEDEKDVRLMDTLGGPQKVTVANDPGEADRSTY